ncbi:class F sortase [Chryseomicrobium sp. FSL W7-1435]|uniref:class F sortase n=1 Tax=Chryseomicrobium sp. FSL W7-1435 TaxID=2921704 RepID=UPI003159A3CA
MKTENVGFDVDVPSTSVEPVVQSIAPPTENPINAALSKGISPKTLRIPAIDVEAPVQHLGTNNLGEMAVPDEIDEVSWFEPGYNPGQNGRAVIAGHVDGLEGPAIFWDLAELQPGDVIEVAGENDDLTFEIYKLESIPLALADVSEVFGYTSSPELVLITCSGTYNREWGTREERLVVYAKLIN